MRIVLLHTAPWRPDMPPLGLPYVQAALRAAGHDVVLEDVNFALFECATGDERSWWEPSHAFVWQHPIGPQLSRFLTRTRPIVDAVLQRVLTPGVQMVGLTMLQTQKAFALWLADRVKALRPHCGVVVGGPQCFPQYEPDVIAAHPNVDWVVIGEGEYTVVDLARWLEAGRSGPVPAGVLTHAGERGPERALDRNIDQIPFPDYSGLPLQKYLDRGRLPLFTSRGCVRRCVFCIEQRVWERFRYRSAGNVFAEMQQGLRRWGATRFEINDSLFNGHMRVLEQLCELIVSDGMQISWGGQGIIRAEMTPAVLARLRQAGCGFITYGFESGSQRVLDRMKKNVDMRVAGRVIRDTHDAGIGQKLNVMVGFPGETEEEFRSTLDFLTANASYIDEVNPSDAFTAIIPGTELYERAQDFGVTDMENTWLWEAPGNDFAIRLDRFERLCRHVNALGIASTYKLDRVANRFQVLGDFCVHKGRWSDALANYDAHAREVRVSPFVLPNYAYARDRLRDTLTASFTASLSTQR